MINLHARDAGKYLVSELCMLFGVSRQAYYKFDGEAAARRMGCESFALEYVREIRTHDRGIGGIKLWHMYKNHFSGAGTLGRDLFSDMLDRYGLKARNRKRKPRTTDSSHGYPTYPDLARNFIPTAPRQLWVSDITYMPICGRRRTFCYLALILDSYSKEIVGSSVGDTLEAKYPMEALDAALSRLDSEGVSAKGLIHHSDRGVQYASREYVKMLKSRGIRVSMTESGDPKDNAQAERINSTMKNELLNGMKFHSIGEAKQAVAAAIDFYNMVRPHMSIDMKTPQQAALCRGPIKKKWRSYREEAIKNKLQACQIAGKGLPLSPANG